MANRLVQFKSELVVRGPTIVAHAFLRKARDITGERLCGAA
jgi:hypothetical protein